MMWDLIVYEIMPWGKMVVNSHLARYKDMSDCLYMHSYAIQDMKRLSAKMSVNLLETYVPMCVQVMN